MVPSPGKVPIPRVVLIKTRIHERKNSTAAKIMNSFAEKRTTLRGRTCASWAGRPSGTPTGLVWGGRGATRRWKPRTGRGGGGGGRLVIEAMRTAGDGMLIGMATLTASNGMQIVEAPLIASCGMLIIEATLTGRTGRQILEAPLTDMLIGAWPLDLQRAGTRPLQPWTRLP